MATEHAIGHVSRIPPGEGRTFDVNGLLVAVFRTRGGGVFATQARCPHRGGPLADGLTDESSVVCPLHDRVYDLRTGVGTDCSIDTYPVRIGIDGMILLVAHPQQAMASQD